LENPILIRLAGLERGLKGLLQDVILDIQDQQLQRYNRFNIKLLQSEKKVCSFFKILHKIGLKNYFEGIQRE